MANKDWDLDAIDFYDDECNCKQYKEEEYKRDLKRYLDENDWFYKSENDEKQYLCNGLADCEKCALYNEVYKYHACSDFAFTSFDTIKKIFVWSQEHPAVTNRDKMIETFGGAYFNLIINYISGRSLEDYDNWLHEEYKEPKGESKNDD